MEGIKDKSLLTRFTRIRKRPQQPLTDLTELYSRIANESIYYLKLEEKQEYRKAVLGWKALNTHVLYELTQIEHQYPHTQHFTKDEISIQNGVRELYHKSLQHLERVTKLHQGAEPEAYSAGKLASSFSRRPAPPASGSRSMLKTLRDPKLQYNKNHTASAPAITNGKPNSRSNSHNAKINFTTSKPLRAENAFNGFDEEQNLIDFSDDDNDVSSKSEPVLASDTASDNGIDFDVQDYFDDYLDVDQEELKRLEAFNNLEGIRSEFNDFSMATKSLSPQAADSQAKPTRVASPPAREKLRQRPAQAPVIRSGALPKTTNSSISTTKRPVRKDADSLSTSRPVAQNSASAPIVKSRATAASTKDVPILNKRVLRAPKPASGGKVSESRSTKSKQPVRASPINTIKGVQQKQGAASAAPTKALPKPKSPPPSTKSRGESVVPASEDIDEKTIKEALEDEIIEQLRGIDKAAAKQIFSEIVVRGDKVHWDDIAGLEAAKNSLKEAVVYPFLRPDLFRGLREPVRGMLLFGPPGTGKTMLARAVATESNSTFFSISASSLTSKYLGESEKLVRALFAIAKKLSPSIVFVDEIDSIMGSRNNDGENESSRRIKNEFLVQWSSLSSAAAGSKGNAAGASNEEEEDERVLILGATNLPWSIDEAARRRFVRRQYIPLPEVETRKKQLSKLLMHQTHTLTEDDFTELLELTDGYSGSDITSLAKDAAMGPLRELGDKLLSTRRDQIRAITLQDVKNSLSYIKPSVSKDGLEQYEEWAEKFGSSGV
ncbi:LADA_0A05710g1_1 [Lachancea dasiensis]|uniref:LADA_0A05710g1_1 n=1 Tax=Lachancea dasiensis TaxID=1072105 RepID=A0A1G4IPI8_9SACH|nr:LADA_0A05710g1_1 [Lachancea dasiensis]